VKNKLYVLGVAALVAAMLAMSGVAHSAMWVGAELGGNLNAYPQMSVNTPRFSDSRATEIRPSLIGGLTLGYDFVNSGFGAYAWPDWMKYFSFALDFTYNRIDIQDVGPGIGKYFANNSRLNGSQPVLTFLFMFHYGFMPDSEVPTGRINPYLGIGPALVFTKVEGTIPTYFDPHSQFSSNGADSALNVGLVVEPGVRFMVMKNVSVDLAMRYRYSAPSWEINNVTIKTGALHQFAPLARAALHF
jgi:opacity protein-like surface antigen